MTFFTIGVASDFRKLWQEGIGKLALVYVLCLFGFIIWIGPGNFLDLLPRRQTAAGGGLTRMDEPKLSEELQKMEYEPLLPVEKRLIAWSLILGVVLLGVLVWISRTWFEV